VQSSHFSILTSVSCQVKLHIKDAIQNPVLTSVSFVQFQSNIMGSAQTLLQLLQSRTIVDCDTMDVEGISYFNDRLLSVSA
jgi:hypothetical protein